MQVIMYARRQYDATLIQQVSEAIQMTWRQDELDLVVIFDTSSALLCEVPTMVRIFTPKNNRNAMTVTSLNSPNNSSHYNAIRLFQHFESVQKSQLIFIEKNADAINVGSKVINQLLNTCNSLLPSRRMIPDSLLFLENEFSIFYQNKTQLDNAENIYSLNIDHSHEGIFDNHLASRRIGV